MLRVGICLLLGFALVQLAPNPHIIGGRKSKKGRWPWMVSLHRWRPDDEEFRHGCGASLITSTWVLTAAHCVDHDADPSDYRALIGAYQQTPTENDAEEVIPAIQIIMHEGYEGSVNGSYPNDIAVVELAYPADLGNENVGLLPLPRSNDGDEVFAGNQDCWVAGWGRLNPDPDNWTSSDILLEVNTAVHDLQTCREIWMDHLNSTETNILEQHICVGLPDRGTCHGDSGSPALCDLTGNGDWVACGINSWGTGSRCAAATNAFVRLSWFMDWLRDKVPGLPGKKPEQPEWEGPEYP